MDTTQLILSTPQRHITLIDAPGHKEFLRHMLTGATHAEAALLVVDATQGMQEQSRRHAYLLQLLGISDVIVAVNKMDAIEYDAAHFAVLTQEIETYFHMIGLPIHAIIPVSARMGEGLGQASALMPWYDGPHLVAALDEVRLAVSAEALPLRMPVQDIYKRDDDRIIVGQIESGQMQVGDRVHLSPSGTEAHVAKIICWPNIPQNTAEAGQSIGFTLDAPLFVERGMMVSHTEAKPALSTLIPGRVFWFDDTPLMVGKRYRLHFSTLTVNAELRSIQAVIQPNTLERNVDAIHVASGMAAEVHFRARALVPLDGFSTHLRTARFAIFDGERVVGGGLVDSAELCDLRGETAVKSTHLTQQPQAISLDERIATNGHLPGIFWFSGLSGAGKSTLAQGVQEVLFRRGRQVFVLDGDNLRQHLSRDLGFSAEDRHEHLRRAAEVAALFAQAGFIVITAFISPSEHDRAVARACLPEWFRHVYIKASLERCEQRDTKGLYKLARAGKIAEFTGISAPFDIPKDPDFVVDTETKTRAQCVAELTEYIESCCTKKAERT